MSKQRPDERAEVAARFELLARALLEPLRRYLRRRTDAETAEDVLAETLLVCWRRLDDVPAEGALPWAYAVARGCLANAERSARRQRRVAGKVAALDPPRATVQVAEGDPELHAALGRLREADAELLRLWAWEQLTPAEIAQVLDVTPNAVSVRLTRAKAALREELDAGKAGSRKDTADAGHEPAKGRQ